MKRCATCSQPAHGRCGQCGQPMCEEHTRTSLGPDGRPQRLCPRCDDERHRRYIDRLNQQ